MHSNPTVRNGQVDDRFLRPATSGLGVLTPLHQKDRCRPFFAQGTAMVRALTKTKETGELYTRRPEIEACLVQAVRQAPATLCARAQIADRKDPQYLPSEALVHLAREAMRAQDETTAGTLINYLSRRCLHRLMRAIRPTNRFDADEVRAQALDAFGDLFADELEDPTKTSLDFFEAQFNSAFANLRVCVLRRVYRHNARFVTPSPAPATADSDAEDEDVFDVADCADESSQSDPVAQLESVEALRRIQSLPAKEREAFLWKGMGFETESADPQETTVATLCGVSGRAIRDRLRSAKARLKRMEEEES